MLCFAWSSGSALGLVTSKSTVSAKVTISVGSLSGITPANAAVSNTYLIGSFPGLRQVAYVHLPDNVWRPLAIGDDVDSPTGVAVDGENSRLFVSDPPNNVIWWYNLAMRRDGLLETGPRHAAVQNFSASWLSVSGLGDLYFTGHQQGAPAASSYDSVYRQDAVNLLSGNSLQPTELFSRSNSGSPNPQAWMPSGVAVDAFSVYWGNQELGGTHGSVVQGLITSGVSQGTSVLPISNALEQVNGVAVTGTSVFWAAPEGVYGRTKGLPLTMSDAQQGFIAGPPQQDWTPAGLAWDGENTLYVADASNDDAAVYSLPALNVQSSQMLKFADAPGINDLAIIGFHPANSGSSVRLQVAPLLVLAMCLVAANAAMLD